MSADVHAELGASSASRWMHCPGSVRLSRPYGGESRASSYAAEGTVAHALAEAALSGVSGPAIGAALEADGRSVVVTHEMEDAVQVYLDVVMPLRKQADWHAFEQGVVIRSAPPQAECFGTADFAALVGHTLHIVDLKYGKGVIVEVEENAQELYYALACYETFDEDRRQCPRDPPRHRPAPDRRRSDERMDDRPPRLADLARQQAPPRHPAGSRWRRDTQ
jgi:hypothetical protein